jgi:hypothetical protein
MSARLLRTAAISSSYEASKKMQCAWRAELDVRRRTALHSLMNTDRKTNFATLKIWVALSVWQMACGMLFWV